MIKASEETLAALNVQSQADVIPAILAKLNESNAKVAELSAKLDAIKPEVTAEDHLWVVETIEKLTKKVVDLSAVNDEAIAKAVAAAKEAGSLAAATALGSVGVNAIAPAPVAEPAKADTADNLVAAGDYEAAYKASEKLQSEFSSPKVFAAYMKAMNRGQVRVLNPKH